MPEFKLPSRLDDYKDPFGDRIQDMRPNQPMIVDLVTLERLYFQVIPQTVDYVPESTWVSIPAMGRNNSNWFYTGSDDTIKFTLSWYSNDTTRQDVLKKVKWLESLSKNDAYTSKPHPVKLIFGDLFKASTFIVKSAGYNLTMFNRSFGMLPALAVQEIILVRVTEGNRTRDEVLKLDT